MGCWYWQQWLHMTKKNHVEPHFDNLYRKECSGSIDSAVSVIWCLMTQKLMLHFILILMTYRNAMMPLMTPLALLDDNASADGITLPKRFKLHVILIILRWGMQLCQCQYQNCHMTKSHVIHYFNHLDVRNAVVL